MIFTIKSGEELTQLGGGSDTIAVYFESSSCAECTNFVPSLEFLAARFPQIIFYTLDTEALPLVESSHKVATLPTTIFYSGGKEVHRVVGAGGLLDGASLVDYTISGNSTRIIASNKLLAASTATGFTSAFTVTPTFSSASLTAKPATHMSIPAIGAIALGGVLLLAALASLYILKRPKLRETQDRKYIPEDAEAFEVKEDEDKPLVNRPFERTPVLHEEAKYDSLRYAD